MRPIVELISPIWDTNSKNVLKKVKSVQKTAARLIMNYYSRGSSVTDMIKESNLDSVEL